MGNSNDTNYRTDHLCKQNEELEERNYQLKKQINILQVKHDDLMQVIKNADKNEIICEQQKYMSSGSWKRFMSIRDAIQEEIRSLNIDKYNLEKNIKQLNLKFEKQKLELESEYQNFRVKIIEKKNQLMRDLLDTKNLSFGKTTNENQEKCECGGRCDDCERLI